MCSVLTGNDVVRTTYENKRFSECACGHISEQAKASQKIEITLFIKMQELATVPEYSTILCRCCHCYPLYGIYRSHDRHPSAHFHAWNLAISQFFLIQIIFYFCSWNERRCFSCWCRIHLIFSFIRTKSKVKRTCSPLAVLQPRLYC